MGTKFDTEIEVRPHEIDINRHVHQSVYLDYVLYARFDQMKRCYKMPMEEFFRMGFTWATRSVSLEFNKPLFLGEKIIVRTWVDEIRQKSVKVCFQILKKENEDMAASGEGIYVLLSRKTGRPENLPGVAVEKYSV
jgi:acyl-CoA thioester hydrolase/thioesterase-3